MGLGTTYALLTFLAGVILLLSWLYATNGNPRSNAMLGQSFLLFAIPIMFAPSQLFQFPMGAWALVACEEGLKAFGSTREKRPTDKFLFVCLFGIWELTIDKPFWGLILEQSGQSMDRLAIAGLVYATALPALMHAATAAIYAFVFERQLWAAIFASWAVHTAFNEAVDYFGVSPFAAFIETVFLLAILAGAAGRNFRSSSIKG